PSSVRFGWERVGVRAAFASRVRSSPVPVRVPSRFESRPGSSPVPVRVPSHQRPVPLSLKGARFYAQVGTQRRPGIRGAPTHPLALSPIGARQTKPRTHRLTNVCRDLTPTAIFVRVPSRQPGHRVTGSTPLVKQCDPTQ